MDRPSDGSLTTPAAARAPAGRSGRVALWVACALGGLAQSLAGTAGTLLAEDIGGSATWSGVPQSAQVAGTALASVGLSRLAERIGRRAALALGAGVAAVSCALAVAGAAAGELLPVLLASGLVGAGNAAVLLGRYAAADLGPEEDRARAMGLVLTTITVGAVIGPNLMSVATPLVPSGHGLAGSYVVAGLAFALSGVVLVAGSGPAGRQSVTRTDDADSAKARPATT